MRAQHDGSSAPTDASYRQELNRTLGLRQLLVYGMIFMVPIAPMAVYGFVARQSYGMVPLVYLVGIVASPVSGVTGRGGSASNPLRRTECDWISAAKPRAGSSFG